jgi:putative hydroxymethylpyrimidine transport system ATP-binding protein
MNSSLSTPPSIHFDNVSVEFDGNALFRHLSFTIEAGKCTCILGPSGCGKSTLLKMISGNPEISYSGEISFSSETQSIGWMSQSDLLLPWFSLYENVLLGARLRGEINDSLKIKAAKLLERAGLAPYSESLPAKLSGGMRQRGALLRTLMEECGLLLMDEPFSALDALTRMKLQDLTAEMTRGKTVLLVTHDPMEALRIGHEIMVFSDSPAQVKNVGAIPGEIPRQLSNASLVSLHTELLSMLMTEKNESI